MECILYLKKKKVIVMKNKGNKKLDGQISKYLGKINKGKQELKKAVVGQDVMVNSLFRAIICDGHVLIEGVPGIAKTLLVKGFAVDIPPLFVFCQ